MPQMIIVTGAGPKRNVLVIAGAAGNLTGTLVRRTNKALSGVLSPTGLLGLIHNIFSGTLMSVRKMGVLLRRYRLRF